jgi:hypothetical protein
MQGIRGARMHTRALKDLPDGMFADFNANVEPCQAA